MATCGHCDKNVGGMRDHIHAKHGYMFYEMGPDFRYYGYEWLKERDWLDPHQIHPEWDKKIQQEKEDAIYRAKRQR